VRFLVIGLGSMGKRRVRCLKNLGYQEQDIVGFDTNPARRRESEEKYGIRTVESIEGLDLGEFSAIIISTPPHIHNQYIDLCIREKIPGFVEASVILEGLEELNRRARSRGVFIAPSCTLKFHSAIKDIRRTVLDGSYGKVTGFSYHSGYYLPDWHPWEKVSDYYVSRKETGGAREILPFELTWIVDVFGKPKTFCGYFGKTMDVKADIDDTYVLTMDFGDHFGTMITDVVSRFMTRNLILNLEKAQVLWNCNENVVKIYDADSRRWIHMTQPSTTSLPGYTGVSAEEMYTEELRSFIDASAGKGRFPNTLDEDIKVLKILSGLEGRNAG
jgi:predicted dehydrogenase